jgi:2-polyprenyl-3-methyl-5-hydroxy-6-metoxy-1,4-benzoquinol methylase
MTLAADTDLSRCALCEEGELRATFSTARLRLARCSACGHRVAEHTVTSGEGRDYHEQYEQGAFLQALRQTRIRQARRILSHVRRYGAGARAILDYGCGRGWFLDEAAAAGFTVAGADTSALAVKLLAARGTPAVLLPSAPTAPLPELPFAPDVLSLLDVVEHFAPEDVIPALRRIVAAVRPNVVVIKVPVASGILHRFASAAAKLGATHPLEQLYQVGTEPPHRSYFTERSLRVALARAGLDVLEALRDPDFEPTSLRDRAAVLAAIPKPLASAAGVAAASAAWLLAMQDSLVMITRPAEVAGTAHPESSLLADRR